LIEPRKRTRPGYDPAAHARSAQEAWGLIVSTSLAHLSAAEIVNHYARCIQIEECFRDPKNPRFGAALRHSLTRVPAAWKC
jgi:hypothetical protein